MDETGLLKSCRVVGLIASVINLLLNPSVWVTNPLPLISGNMPDFESLV
jgi:hypothetical protein